MLESPLHNLWEHGYKNRHYPHCRWYSSGESAEHITRPPPSEFLWRGASLAGFVVAKRHSKCRPLHPSGWSVFYARPICLPSESIIGESMCAGVQNILPGAMRDRKPGWVIWELCSLPGCPLGKAGSAWRGHGASGSTRCLTNRPGLGWTTRRRSPSRTCGYIGPSCRGCPPGTIWPLPDAATPPSPADCRPRPACLWCRIR